MKITLINGAANGYGQGIEKITDIVVNTFKELEVKITEINLSLLKLPYYDGTNYTSIEKIINDIKSADGIIFACSALKFSPSAIMQTFIEHLDPYLYGEILNGKNCFTIVSSYDGSEYFADEYLNRVLRSLGAYGAVRLAAGREYAQKITYDSSVIDIIEKHAEDFYRILKRNGSFIISQGETSNAFSQSIQQSSQRNGDTGFTPVPVDDNYKTNEPYKPQYSENEYYDAAGKSEYTPKYAKQQNAYNEAPKYSQDRNEYNKPEKHPYGRTQYSEPQMHRQPERYEESQRYPSRQEQYNEPEKYQQQERYNEPQRYSSRQEQYNDNAKSSVNYSGFDKQQENDINELTKLLADEYNKSESYSDNNINYARAKNVSSLYKNNFNPSEPVIPHTKTCKQKTQSLYHHFNSQLAKGLDAVIQLNITGNETFSSCLTIGGGECIYSDGVHPSPSVTIFADSVIWNDILDGKLTSQKAFMVGQIKVKGNFALLSKFDQLFKIK